MKKLFWFCIILGSLTFSKEVNGYTRYIENKDIDILKEVKNPKEYLEEKYKGLYDVEDKGDELIIYPKIQFIKINSKIRDKQAILDSLPSIYIGKTVKYFEDILSEKNSFMLKDEKNVYLYIRASIDDEGRYGILVDEYMEKDIDTSFMVDIVNTSTEVLSNLEFNNFRDNDVMKLNSSISLENKFNAKINFGYSISDYKNFNKYFVESGIDTDKNVHLRVKYDKYLIGENKGSYKQDLKLGTELEYRYKKEHTLNFKTNYEYNFRKEGFIFYNKGFLNYRQNLLNLGSNIILGNNVVLKWDTQYQNSTVDTNLEFAFKNSNSDIKTRNLRALDKYLKGDMILDYKLQWNTLDIVGTKVYLFNDFGYTRIYENNDRKYSTGFGIGASNRYIKNLEIDTYAGAGFNSSRIGFVGGIGVKIQK